MKLRHSTISAESSITELANSDPARPYHGPKDFARTLQALSSLLKASSEPSRPRVRASFGRRGREGLTLSTKQPETTLNKTGFEKPDTREDAVFARLKAITKQTKKQTPTNQPRNNNKNNKQSTKKTRKQQQPTKTTKNKTQKKQTLKVD